MRTTVNLSTTALATARRYAAARSVNLGQAVSDLIEQTERQRLTMRSVDGVWVADLPNDKVAVAADHLARGSVIAKAFSVSASAQAEASPGRGCRR